MFHVHVAAVPPLANKRLRPIVRADGKPGLVGRKVTSFQAPLGLLAKVQLRKAGLLGPLQGPLLAVVAWWTPRGDRDADSGLKDTLDALNKVAWQDDKQLVCSPPGFLFRGGPRTDVWVFGLEESRAWSELQLSLVADACRERVA